MYYLHFTSSALDILTVDVITVDERRAITVTDIDCRDVKRSPLPLTALTTPTPVATILNSEQKLTQQCLAIWGISAIDEVIYL